MAAISLKLALAAVLCTVLLAQYHTSKAAITCGTVYQAAIPCLNYLRGMGPLTGGCCSGIITLNKVAATTPDRQAVCKCLEQGARAVSGINHGNAAALPGKCGISIPYKISTSINCATVH